MRRVLDIAKFVVQRVNPRLAILVVAVAASGVAVWQGVSRWRSTPKGPAKQVATGVDGAGVAPATVQPAVASLSDDQLPAASAEGSHRLLQYGQPADAQSSPPQPQTNPYAPTASDPAGGYSTSRGSSRYSPGASAYGQFSDAPPPTTVPGDPTSSPPPADAVPENIYRPSPAARSQSEAPTAPVQNDPASAPAYAPLTQSPYAASAQNAYATSPPSPSGPSPADVPTPRVPASDLTPSAAAPSNYGNRYSLPAAEFAQPATSPPAAFPQPPATTVPVNELSSSPYSSAPAPTRSPASAASPFAMNQQRALNSHTNPLPRGEAGMAAATPGERQLEGPQQPSLALEKVSPSEIQIGKPATFELYVRNAGRVPANNVVVTDHVPAGTQLVDARPPPQPAADGSLVWSLGTMQPGEESQITLVVSPQTEGEIGSTAHVSFGVAATSRSISTRPQLTIEQTAPPKVLIGEPLAVRITISNPGTGPATGIIIEEDVPAGLAHVAGSQLEYEVGTLRPGESKQLDLTLRAEKPGLVQNVIQVRGDANLSARHAVQIEVVAPQLQVAVEGPKVRFLERQATYTVQVANPGTAAARDVELIAHLPRGLKFVATDSQGQYDLSQHAVFWSLAELPPATKGAVKLTTLPVEPGDQPLRIEGRGALGVTASGEQIVRVEQAAELVHTLKDLDEVIEVGSETTYEIRVLNKGTKAATNVRIAALMPAGMAAIHGEGPTRAAGDATQIVFEPLARLNPQEEVIYKVQAQGKQPGDQIIRVQIASDEWPSPVTREESTRVYQDR